MPPAVLAAVAAGAAAGALGLSTVTIAGSAILGGAILYGGLALAQYLITPKPPILGNGSGSGLDPRQTIISAIVPARWVLGRARVGGVLVYQVQNSEKDKEFHMLLAVCEGPVAELEKVWIDGEEVHLVGDRSQAAAELVPLEGTKYANHLKLTFYSNGIPPGSELQQVPGSQWTDQHRLEGVACVHIKMTQNDYGTGDVERLYTNIPKFNFLVKGLKFKHPGVQSADWSNNAAAVRYWWLTNRRQIPPSAIDRKGFIEAFNISEMLVNNDLSQDLIDQGFDRQSQRYTINGVIQSTDDHTQIEKEMDFAWAGYVVEQAGTHYFRPGATRTIKAGIDSNDIISRLNIQPAPALSDRVNSASMRIAQSKRHDYQELGLDDLIDQDAIRRDRRELKRDFGSRAFVNDPSTAGRLLAIMLRRARANKLYTIRVSPGKDMKFFDLIPTDRVRLNDPELGINNEALAITAKTINADLSINLTLESEPDGIYSDTAIIPSSRGIAYRSGSGRPAEPGDVRVIAQAFRTDDFTIHSLISISWLPTPHRTRIEISGPFNDIQETERSDINIFVPYAGRYVLRIRHVNRFSQLSKAVIEFANIDWSEVIVNTASAGVESIFALIEADKVSASNEILINPDQYPDDNWGFRRAGVAGGLRWFNGPQSITQSKPIQITAIRFTEGTPPVGSEINSEWLAPSIYSSLGISGEDGADGLGRELIFAVSTSDSRRPDLPNNAWGFDQPQDPWQDGAPPLTLQNKVLWQSQRRLEGDPAVGAQIPSLWSAPAIVGRYGDRGARGSRGPAGEKGEKGDPAIRIWQLLYDLGQDFTTSNPIQFGNSTARPKRLSSYKWIICFGRGNNGEFGWSASIDTARLIVRSRSGNLDLQSISGNNAFWRPFVRHSVFGSGVNQVDQLTFGFFRAEWAGNGHIDEIWGIDLSNA